MDCLFRHRLLAFAYIAERAAEARGHGPPPALSALASLQARSTVARPAPRLSPIRTHKNQGERGPQPPRAPRARRRCVRFAHGNRQRRSPRERRRASLRSRASGRRALSIVARSPISAKPPPMMSSRRRNPCGVPNSSWGLSNPAPRLVAITPPDSPGNSSGGGSAPVEKARVARLRRFSVGRADDLSHLHRQSNIRVHVGPPLGLVSVEQTVGRRPLQYAIELPGEAPGVANTRTHSLPHEGRHQVGCVAGDEKPPRCAYP